MLKKNRWFQYGLKIALAIGSNVDLDVLREFTDDEELVLQACGAEMLKKLVREIAVCRRRFGENRCLHQGKKAVRKVHVVLLDEVTGVDFLFPNAAFKAFPLFEICHCAPLLMYGSPGVFRPALSIIPSYLLFYFYQFDLEVQFFSSHLMVGI